MVNASEIPRPVLRLDPWMPDYEGAIQIDPADDGTPGQVDTNVETGDWKAVAVSTARTAPSLYFIDGVRRTEARALAWDQSGLVHGLFGAVVVFQLV